MTASKPSNDIIIKVEKPEKQGLSTADVPSDKMAISNPEASDEKLGDEQTSEQTLSKEINGPKGLEPTRYGDWESKGRCHDF